MKFPIFYVDLTKTIDQKLMRKKKMGREKSQLNSLSKLPTWEKDLHNKVDAWRVTIYHLELEVLI